MINCKGGTYNYVFNINERWLKITARNLVYLFSRPLSFLQQHLVYTSNYYTHRGQLICIPVYIVRRLSELHEKMSRAPSSMLLTDRVIEKWYCVRSRRAAHRCQLSWKFGPCSRGVPLGAKYVQCPGFSYISISWLRLPYIYTQGMQ